MIPRARAPGSVDHAAELLEMLRARPRGALAPPILHSAARGLAAPRVDAAPTVPAGEIGPIDLVRAELDVMRSELARALELVAHACEGTGDARAALDALAAVQARERHLVLQTIGEGWRDYLEPLSWAQQAGTVAGLARRLLERGRP